ncbi:ROK family protein [Streptobacillus felis]|uniref:ROK family protein n=1 Tax=Streptobacillus felis TaxID=1384509 RepID=A0A7Z0PFR4_9FUSO|nr:ROK family protein [Streptobacillus felis]NYV27405.1 ROK family protein [Streptobacillus felis]
MKYYGGIDLGGTNSKIGILDETGKIVYSTIVKTESSLGYEESVKKLSDHIKFGLEKNGISYSDFVSLGIGVPGPIVNKSTVLMWANFPWPNNLNLAKEFENELLKPVFLDNDVNVITLGELWVGAAKGYKNVLGMAIGTGIGGGVVVNGEIISGKNGASGEIGHIPIEKKGRLCGCGKRGCFEAYASATGIARIAKDRLQVNKNNELYNLTYGRDPEAKDVFECAKNGDKLSLDIVEETAEYLAIGISSALSILDSDIVVIGGGVALAGDFLIDKIKKYLPEYLMSSIVNNVEIKIAKLGNDAGIYGAAYLAMQSVK